MLIATDVGFSSFRIAIYCQKKLSLKKKRKKKLIVLAVALVSIEPFSKCQMYLPLRVITLIGLVNAGMGSMIS